MRKLSLIIAAVFIFGVANVVKAQDEATTNHTLGITIPTINLVALEDASGEAASDVDWNWNAENLWGTKAGAFNNDQPIALSQKFFLKYTSVVSKNETNEITAEIDASDLPGAITLQLKTSPNAKASSKKGKTGNGTGNFVSLSSTAVPIVSSIKTAYTGTDDDAGHELNYQLVINPDYSNSEADEDFGDLQAGTYSATVLYTITDN